MIAVAGTIVYPSSGEHDRHLHEHAGAKRARLVVGDVGPDAYGAGGVVEDRIHGRDLGVLGAPGPASPSSSVIRAVIPTWTSARRCWGGGRRAPSRRPRARRPPSRVQELPGSRYGCRPCLRTGPDRLPRDLGADRSASVVACRSTASSLSRVAARWTALSRAGASGRAGLREAAPRDRGLELGALDGRVERSTRTWPASRRPRTPKRIAVTTPATSVPQRHTASGGDATHGGDQFFPFPLSAIAVETASGRGRRPICSFRTRSAWRSGRPRRLPTSTPTTKRMLSTVTTHNARNLPLEARSMPAT